MGSMVQSYLPNGTSKSVTTAPAGGGVGGGAGSDDLMQMFRELARQRMAPSIGGGGIMQRMAPQARPQPSIAGRSGPVSVAPQRSTQNEHGNTGPGPAAQQEAELAQLRAISGGQPMKMVNSGPGIIGGYMPDPNAMNGAQRKAFLPNNAQSDPRVDADAEARRRMLDAASFQDFQAQAATRGTARTGY